MKTTERPRRGGGKRARKESGCGQLQGANTATNELAAAQRTSRAQAGEGRGTFTMVQPPDHRSRHSGPRPHPHILRRPREFDP